MTNSWHETDPAAEDEAARRVRVLADQIITATAPATLPAPAGPPPGCRYLLPTTLLSHGGIYEYVLIDVAQARQWLLAGPCQSFVTHPMLHAALQTIIGFCLPPRRYGPLPHLGSHDDALCFVVAGYETLPDLRRGDSRQVQALVEGDLWTLGLLRRLA